MSDIIKADTSWSCLVCRKVGRKGARVISEGGFYRHPACAMAPAADTQQCSEPRCTCEGNGGPEHELAIIGAFDDPTGMGPALGPREQLGEKGPWFGAMYDGKCSSCEDDISEGDRIRADGQGGYECEDCGDDPGSVTDTDAYDNPGRSHDWQGQASAAVKRHMALVTAEPNGDAAQLAVQKLAEDAANAHAAAQASDTPFVALLKTELGADMANAHAAAQAFLDSEDPDPEKNVSGQPRPQYEWRGKQNLGYLVKLPWTGDYQRYDNGKPKGLTRATTFNKELSRDLALSDWRARNVLIGATRRPDVVDRAHGMTHEANYRELMGLVAELETAAGAKVSADIGTYLHGFTEEIDAGLKTPADAPERYRAQLELYVSTLADAGFEMVPGLIERTTMIREYGGVVGTFDRVVYHRPTGTYMIADLKTGKTTDYLVEETETQEWIYAHGVNQHGVYDWNTNTWQPVGDPMTRGPHPDGHPITVSETQGLIIWMPVQGDHAGTVKLLDADLEAGRRHAERCHAARTRPKRKPKAWAAPAAARPLSWDDRFAVVTVPEQASKLWVEARAAGVAPMELQRLVGLAQQALARLGF